ncbi:hypothetical protein TNIN_25711 [Trichonephila inaurata madagascariensis]|uniref:Uncharacterized protein n=1 Tax=Trichonephila inaurata madagascariensis TaxID=2747483 RepID=A0A8X7C8F3_9ARAC|nr:hypothetical protein TNIN_25711 [Trichonephila inaurata madagascariensis]
MKPYYDPDLQAHFNDSVASDDRRFGKSTPSNGRNDSTGPTTHSRSKPIRQTRYNQRGRCSFKEGAHIDA